MDLGKWYLSSQQGSIIFGCSCSTLFESMVHPSVTESLGWEWPWQQWARNLSGVITWEHHMCVNTCVGFTSPFANLNQCPKCGEPQYKEKDLEESDGERKVPQQVFTIFPVSPQIQAHWKHSQTAKDMFYWWEKTKELHNGYYGLYDNILCGESYQKLIDNGLVGKYDTVLILLMDSMQLYQSKQSDCWIYIWILIDLRPDKCYKIQNVLLGSIILGPEPPDNLKSFLFPGLAHVAMLQCKGLPIWDAYHWKCAITFLFSWSWQTQLQWPYSADLLDTMAGKAVGYSADFLGEIRLRVCTITQPSYDLLDSKTIGLPPTQTSTSALFPLQTPMNINRIYSMLSPLNWRTTSGGVATIRV